MENIKLSIRIPVDLHKRLEAEASTQLRSLNKQLEAILKERYNAHAPPIPIKSTNHSQAKGLIKRKAAIS